MNPRDPAPVGSYDVLVAVPAHDEVDRIGTCLRSVVSALHAAQVAALVGRARIAVGAHRCRDDTAAVAARAIRETGWPDAIVVELDDDLPVGLVRTRLARHAVLAEPALEPDRLWLLSTDADSVVPLDWVSGLLRAAWEGEADVVAGLVDLVGWRGGRAARRAYRQILAEKLLPDGGHEHVYAANLAIRWTTFQAIDGFPGLPHGEEAGLLRAATDAGARLATPRAPRVRTSGRVPGRAPQGLADLLGRLHDEAAAPH